MTFCLLMCISENAVAQRQKGHQQYVVQLEKISPIQKVPYQSIGHYHEFISDVNTPIERKMTEAKFCEIEDNYLLIPYQNSELVKKGYLPVIELANKSIYYLLEDDVFEYFEQLKSEYNTPLKVKRFEESQEYTDLIHQLDCDKTLLLENTFYSIRTISEDETFDLDNKCFKIQLPNAFGRYCGIFLDTEDNHFEWSSEWLKFITPEMDEDTAFKIESNTCEVIVFVKFIGETRIYGAWEQAICVPIKIYIADKNTGDVYFEYTPYKELPNPTPKVKDEISQEPKSKEESTEEKVYDTVETAPKFPGGATALFKFISENLKYPKEAAKQGIQGRVIVQFVVGKDGSLQNVGITRGVSPELDKEAIRVFKHPKMPKWEPGRYKGKPVNVHFRCPITFKLSGN